MNAEDRRDLLLSVQRALVGEVTANLYCVTAGWRGPNAIVMHMYFYSEPTDQERLDMESVASEVVADFSRVSDIRVECSKAAGTPDTDDIWVFLRKEMPSDVLRRT